MLVARNQQALGTMSQSSAQETMSQQPSHSSHNALAQLQQQIALSRKQQQQQQQQQKQQHQMQMPPHQYDLTQQDRPIQMTAQNQQQSLRLLQSQGPPNVSIGTDTVIASLYFGFYKFITVFSLGTT